MPCTGNHPNAGSGLWGSSNEVPSFLYAMPLGGSRVFLEETCLVAKPALPFAVLKRRLERRMAAMGVTVKSIHEEEWSYIPVGGPMPLPGQAITAFGAAANLVHPATGFSVSRTLREAPAMADGITAALAARTPVTQTAAAVWDTLWPAERRRQVRRWQAACRNGGRGLFTLPLQCTTRGPSLPRHQPYERAPLPPSSPTCSQAAFHIFGMELLAQLDLAATNDFFDTFFALPDTYWRGFLGSSLSSAQLLAFAMLTFFVAPPGIKAKLVSFLVSGGAAGVVWWELCAGGTQLLIFLMSCVLSRTASAAAKSGCRTGWSCWLEQQRGRCLECTCRLQGAICTCKPPPLALP